jgi:hypothetical protein
MRLVRTLVLAFAAGGVVAAALATSCSLVTSYDCFSAPCGASDAAVDADAGGPGCALRAPPPAPAGGGVEEGDSKLVLAMSRLSLDLEKPDSGFNNVGFDLDGKCTCQPDAAPDPGSCLNPQAKEPACDGLGGVDRQSTKLFASTARIFGDKNLQEGLEAGDFSVLVQVVGYNEKPNDGRVGVSVFNGLGLRRGDGGLLDGGPSFDGGDDWVLDSDSVLGGADREFEGRARDDTAYVAGGRLFARLKTFSLRFRVRFVVGPQTLFAFLKLDLRDVVLAGDLVANAGGGFRLERGELSARFPMASALALAESAGAGCRGSSGYQNFREVVCPLADLPAASGAAATAPCEALSFALGFEAAPAQYKGTQAAPPPLTFCDSGAVPDTCF